MQSTPRGLPLGEGDEESNTFKFSIFQIFVHSTSRFFQILSTQGPIFKFFSILGHNCFICRLYRFCEVLCLL